MHANKIERFELRYLEIIAERIYNAMGKKGWDNLDTSNNPIFCFLFISNQYLCQRKNRFLCVFLRLCRSLFRSILCNRMFFCLNSHNS